jgi:hypothetical protein
MGGRVSTVKWGREKERHTEIQRPGGVLVVMKNEWYCVALWLVSYVRCGIYGRRAESTYMGLDFRSFTMNMMTVARYIPLLIRIIYHDQACASDSRQPSLARPLTTVPHWRYHAARTTPRKSRPSCGNTCGCR